MSYVKVNGVYKQWDKAFHKVSGVWKEVDKVFTKVTDTWKESWQSITMLYDTGVEYVPIVKGTSSISSNIYQENTTNIYIEGKSLDTNEYIAAVTDVMLDLTNFNKIILVADIDKNTTATLEVNSTSKYPFAYSGQAMTSLTKDRYTTLGEHTLTLDVSTLTGSYYIMVWSHSYQAIGFNSKVYIKNMHME